MAYARKAGHGKTESYSIGFCFTETVLNTYNHHALEPLDGLDAFEAHILLAHNIGNRLDILLMWQIATVFTVGCRLARSFQYKYFNSDSKIVFPNHSHKSVEEIK